MTYEFAEFTRPVAIVPGEALRSESSTDLMYLFVPGREGPSGAEVFFLGMDEILDPTASRSPKECGLSLWPEWQWPDRRMLQAP